MEIECEICHKKYKSRTWYNRHMIKAHPKPPEVRLPTPSDSAEAGPSRPSSDKDDDDSDDADAAAAAEIAAAKTLDWEEWSGTDDDEDTETYCRLIMDPWREEEEEERRREARAGLAPVEDVPRAKEQSTPRALVTCKDCSATFDTLSSYFKHRVGHGMQAAVLGLPPISTIAKECPQLARSVLQEIQESKLTGGPALQLKILSSEIEKHVESELMSPVFYNLTESLLSFIQGKNFLLPSALAYDFFLNSSKVALDKDLRASLISSFSAVVEIGPESQNIFIATFISKYSQKLLAYLIRVMSKGLQSRFESVESRYAVTYQSTLSLDFKQNMHYIGGSNIKSIVKTALRVKHRNAEWHRLMTTLKEQFIVNELAVAPEPELMAWTERLDRGRLTKISKKALDFFVQLGTEVKPLERADGSLLNDEVIETIVKSAPLLLRWDELKGSLSGKESFKLLHAITYQFCITWRNGIIGRRTDQLAENNKARKFGTGGVSFRSTLVGK